MYHRINPTETFRERHLALLRVAEDKRRARRLRAPKACESKREGVRKMTNTQTATKTNHYFKVLVALAVLVMMAAGLMAAQPAHAATPLTVNSTGDFHDTITNDGFCGFGGSCSLRAAIEEANSNPTFTEIDFDIPGTGVKTIVVNSTGLGALPAITTQVTIDGYTQTGAHPNTLAVGNDAVLKIELDGTNVGGKGLEISTADNSVIKGLVINRFGEGIDISGDSVANRIEGNFIGTDPTGTLDKGNSDDGVNVFDGASENVVGGTTPAARNLISGNSCNAVLVSGANNNRIQGNYIGTDKTGTKGLANGDLICTAVFINDAPGNTVGGTTAGARNVISGNAFEGVGIFGGSQDNEVLGNRIGTTAGGTGPLGNGEAGVLIRGSNNSVGNGTAGGSNTIAFNGKDGVEVAGNLGFANEISRNSIFSNVGIGIDLVGGVEDVQGNTANDAGDIDTGPNDLQNKPVLSSAKTVSGKTTVKGTLNSRTDFGYVIRFFSNPSGTNEGKKFIGQKTVLPAPSGNAACTFSPASAVAVGQTITATATTNGERVHQTSEFSAARKVASS
jgi:CSLREA domain-containing protein